jgi:hypothetical protein
MLETGSSVSSRESTPEVTLDATKTPPESTTDGLFQLSSAEIIRLLEIYEEEIACVHPVVDATVLMQSTPHVLEFIKHSSRTRMDAGQIGLKDVHMVKIAIATAMIHENYGRNEMSDGLIKSVEQEVDVISLAGSVELKDIQIMGMLVIPHTCGLIVADICAEPVFLSHLRRTLRMACNWSSSPPSFGNGITPPTKPFRQLQRSERPQYRRPSLLGSI